MGQIELDPAGQETDDNFSSTTMTMAYKYPFTRDHSLGLTVNLGHLNNFDTDQFDIDNIRGSWPITRVTKPIDLNMALHPEKSIWIKTAFKNFLL